MPSREKMKQQRKPCGHCASASGYLRKRTDRHVGMENVCRKCVWITPASGINVGIAWEPEKKE